MRARGWWAGRFLAAIAVVSLANLGAAAFSGPSVAATARVTPLAPSQRGGAVVTSAIQETGGLFAAKQQSNVVPAVACVTPTSGSTTGYTAYFGYSNSGGAVNYPIGQLNSLTPSSLNGAQPTSFVSGTVTNAFNVTVASGSVTWTVQSQSATATLSSVACAGSSLPLDPLGLSLVVAIGAGLVVGVVMVKRTAKRKVRL